MVEQSYGWGQVDSNLIHSILQKVTIGTRVLFAPDVHVYAATHSVDVEERKAGLERAYPVTIGNDGEHSTTLQSALNVRHVRSLTRLCDHSAKCGSVAARASLAHARSGTASLSQRVPSPRGSWKLTAYMEVSCIKAL